MARLKGSLFTSTLDASKRGPIDSRELVTKYEDLINPSIWITTGSTVDALYNGLRVSVSEVGAHFGLYLLIDRKAITQDNYNNYLAAKAVGKDLTPYFSMWSKVITEKDKFILNGGNANG